MIDQRQPSDPEINRSQYTERNNHVSAFYLKLLIGGIALVSALGLGLFFTTAVWQARDAAHRQAVKQNLTQISIALERYAARQKSSE